jgi:hypothetical protein
MTTPNTQSPASPNPLEVPLKWLIDAANAYVYAQSAEERNYAFKDVSHALSQATKALKK